MPYKDPLRQRIAVKAWKERHPEMSDTLLGINPRSFLGYACDTFRYVDAQRLCPSPGTRTRGH